MNILNLRISYRFVGAGKACAGHNTARLANTLNWKPLVVCALGNFGGTRPTGSAHVGRRLIYEDRTPHGSSKLPDDN